MKAAPETHPASRCWHGDDLAGGKPLLHAEQGHGDTIQFCRYVPFAAERGLSVTLAVPRQLQRLIRTMPGAAEVVAGDGAGLDYDRHCPPMSLPWVFGTSLATIPEKVPHLYSFAGASMATWLPSASRALRVGLSWRGNPADQDDSERLLPADLGPARLRRRLALDART